VSSYTLAELKEVIKTVEKQKKKLLLAQFVERAYEEDKVLIALMKKVVPDTQQVEVSGLEQLLQSMDKDELNKRIGQLDSTAAALRLEVGGGQETVQ
jgi:hypothetical protein